MQLNIPCLAAVFVIIIVVAVVFFSFPVVYCVFVVARAFTPLSIQTEHVIHNMLMLNVEDNEKKNRPETSTLRRYENVEKTDSSRVMRRDEKKREEYVHVQVFKYLTKTP